MDRRGLRRSIPEVGPPGTLLARPDAIPPVITVSETAPWPTNDRRFDFSELLDQRAANAILIGNFGVFANPHAVINDAAKIFGEVSVDVGRDRAQRLREQNIDARVGDARRRQLRGQRWPLEKQGCQRGTPPKQKFSSSWNVPLVICLVFQDWAAQRTRRGRDRASAGESDGAPTLTVVLTSILFVRRSTTSAYGSCGLSRLSTLHSVSRVCGS